MIAYLRLRMSAAVRRNSESAGMSSSATVSSLLASSSASWIVSELMEYLQEMDELKLW